MNSAIYQGTLTHKRECEPAHRFHYSMRLFYVDLDDLPALIAQSRFWSLRPSLAWFRRRDFLPQFSGSLKAAATACIADHTGVQFHGKIFLLSAPRVLGIGFNPISLYYCYAPNGVLQFVIAEVRNTPWLERHVYLLDVREQPSPTPHAKAFHVSPFMDMKHDYHWHLPSPGQRLRVGIINKRDETVVFRAALVMRKAHDLSPALLDKELWRHWPQGLKTLIGIYWQAVKLLSKRAPFYSHPGKPPAQSPEAVENKS